MDWLIVLANIIKTKNLNFVYKDERELQKTRKNI
jgi:hypothetical protein